MSQRKNRTTRRRKMLALVAAGTAVGVATLGTLATWNDNEWVHGGANGGTDDPGVGTSTFDVWQNRATTPPAAAGTGWDDQETNPGGALTFSIDPSALSPGDVMYAPVALQTKADSVAGTLALQPAVPAPAPNTAVDAGDALWNALELSVSVTDTQANAACNAASFTTNTVLLNGATGLGSAPSAATQPVSADRGNVQYYCFRIELPEGSPDTLQGRKVFPAWRFAAVSS